MAENYQKEMERVLGQLKPHTGQTAPTLLLHSCCGPCSTYVLETLSAYFEIYLLYYNPNIYPPEEYAMRAREQERYMKECSFCNAVHFIEGDYEPSDFYQAVRGMEECREGEERCYACYRLRLREAAAWGDKLSCDYFTTTLSISPYKNAQWLNEIGQELAREYGIAYLPSDFKKKDGYRKSAKISAEHGMYRQNYCGCVFSLREREQTMREQNRQTKEMLI